MAKDTVTALVKKGVTVVRDGKRVRPEIGKNFDFTADEAEAINGADAGALAAPLDTSAKGNAEAASETGEGGKPKTTPKTKTAPAKSTATKAADEGGAGDDAGSKTNAGAGAGGDDDL